MPKREPVGAYAKRIARINGLTPSQMADSLVLRIERGERERCAAHVDAEAENQAMAARDMRTKYPEPRKPKIEREIQFHHENEGMLRTLAHQLRTL